MAWDSKPRVRRTQAICPECRRVYVREVLSECAPDLGEDSFFMCEECKTHFVAESGATSRPMEGRALAVNEAVYKTWGGVVDKARRERGVAVKDCASLHAYFTELVDAVLKGDSVENRAAKAKELLDGRFSTYAK